MKQIALEAFTASQCAVKLDDVGGVEGAGGCKVGAGGGVGGWNGGFKDG